MFNWLIWTQVYHIAYSAVDCMSHESVHSTGDLSGSFNEETELQRDWLFQRANLLHDLTNLILHQKAFCLYSSLNQWFYFFGVASLQNN